MKYIDADLLKKEIKRLKDEYTDIAIDSQRGWVNANFVIDDLEQLQSQIDSLQQEQPVLRGWVAREDKGRLLLFGEKPLRNGNYGWKSSSFCIELNSNLYLDLMWIDDPIEVELLINKK